jgi:hypothetical protein
MNEHLRNLPRTNHTFDANAPLAVDLHYLMTVWANNALAEHTILSWAMRELYRHPILDKSSLSSEADWNTADVIQLIPAELSNEDIMRIWDALVQNVYQLSVPYVARVVRIDLDRAVVGVLPHDDHPPSVSNEVERLGDRFGPAGRNHGFVLPRIVYSKLLFNGHDLEGWEGQKYWSVTNGVIRGANETEVPASSYLFTRKSYRNFRLLPRSIHTLEHSEGDPMILLSSCC